MQIVSKDTTSEPTLTTKPKILVAEDNQINQKLMHLLFQKLNIGIDIVGNGKDAVDAVLANGYDLVFMDINMPVMDGIEACSVIKQKLKNKAPAVVALTASIGAGDRQLYQEVGMDSFVPKPLKIEDVQKAIAEYTFV